MSQRASHRPRSVRDMSGLPPQLHTAATVTAAAGVLGLALAAFGWTGPVDIASTAKPGSTVVLDRQR